MHFKFRHFFRIWHNLFPPLFSFFNSKTPTFFLVIFKCLIVYNQKPGPIMSCCFSIFTVHPPPHPQPSTLSSKGNMCRGRGKWCIKYNHPPSVGDKSRRNDDMIHFALRIYSNSFGFKPTYL
jgi:hypothetical protein